MTPPASGLSLIPPLSMPDRVRAIRYFSGLNQTELAKLLQCSQGTISKLENGELEPTAYHLVRMREVFGVSIDAIVDGLIPYRAIAERFSNTDLLPSRYARGAATKLKFLYPLIRALEIRRGEPAVLKVIQKLDLKPAVFAEPELLVSANAFYDLMEFNRAGGSTPAKDFWTDVQRCVGEIHASLPTAAFSADEWTNFDKWHLGNSQSDDTEWGAKPYADAIIKGLRQSIPAGARRRRA